jgi:hypothetical protein
VRAPYVPSASHKARSSATPHIDINFSMTSGRDAILQDIHTNMPGLKQVAWEFEPDGPKVYAARNNSVAQAVIELMRTREPGQTPLPEPSIHVVTRKLSKSLGEVLRERFGISSSRCRR